MQTERAQDLLEAVGIDWKKRDDLCRDSRPAYEIGGDNTAYFAATDTTTYTGPALGTPELDAILLVAGQRWLRDAAHSIKRDVAKNLRYDSFEKGSGGWVSGRLGLMFQSPLPGHALARAIAEIPHA